MSEYVRNNNARFGLNRSLPKYIDHKLDMLENEFYLKLTYEEERYMRSLKSHEAVDQFAHKLLVEKL